MSPLDLTVRENPSYDNGPAPRAYIDYAKAIEASLTSLTDRQREAVTAPPNPELILAGAGTGKTKCLVSRIAHKIGTRQALPSDILAVTFTRKAAQEMRNRLEGMIGPTALGMDIGTFHAVSNRMLRADSALAGLLPGFSVLDADDQKKIVREIIKESGATYDSDEILQDIERYKSFACLHDDPFSAPMQYPDIVNEYQRKLRASNCIDFTDIITKTIDLLRSNPDVRAWYRQTWPTILVDEYQDANGLQELWLDLLSPPDENNDLTCVGDDDQSIYSWRAADIENILGFPNKRKNVTVVRLEENFRSVSSILDFANVIISENSRRHGKVLFTSDHQDNAVTIMDGDDAFANEFEERDFIVDQIVKGIRSGLQPKQFAVICRTAMPLKLLQAPLTYNKIPFTVTAGRKINETQEIKAITAHMRVAINENDDIALKTAIESKSRGFGAKAMQEAMYAAKNAGQPLHRIIQAWLEDGKISGQKAANLRTFYEFIDEIADMMNLGGSLDLIVNHIVADIGLEAECVALREKADKATDKAAKRTLLKKAQGIEERIKEFVAQAAKEEDYITFIDAMSLSEITEIKENAVWLGTIHGAKGLEFDTVFLPAWEKNIFPGRASAEDDNSLEEERRLAYVALTRARKKVYISYSQQVRDYMANGKYDNRGGSNKSQFLELLQAAA